VLAAMSGGLERGENESSMSKLKRRTVVRLAEEEEHR
jgi:hypothetical protein